MCRWDRREILIRNAKGQKDRVTVIPAVCLKPLAANIDRSREYFEIDMQEGIDCIELPNALNRKYPGAGKQFK